MMPSPVLKVGGWLPSSSHTYRSFMPDAMPTAPAMAVPVAVTAVISGKSTVAKGAASRVSVWPVSGAVVQMPGPAAANRLVPIFELSIRFAPPTIERLVKAVV